MRRSLFKMNMLIFLCVYLGPLHSSANGSQMRNYFNDYRKDTIHYPPTNENQEKDLNKIILRIFPNVTVLPRTPSSPSLSYNTAQPRSIPPTISTIPTQHSGNFHENITTSYYSTDVEDYPDYSVIAAKLQKFQGLKFKDSLPKPELSTHTLLEPDAYKYRHLCRSQTDLVAAREIRDRANRVVRMVNYPEYEQKIVTEVCATKDDQCSYSENFPNNLVPICKQNFIFRKVVLMTDDSKDPDLYVDDVSIPSCCECVLKDMTMA